ncbi:MAG: Ig-like domain-containing protein, partial [Anaerolineae bacterium]|nr:Ig-like domain-containing protein [Anaerolineae bacterium]
MRRVALIVIALLVSLCCLATAGGLAYLFFSVPRAEARPVVLIQSPGQGEKVQVGEAVVVQATARDQTGIVRVELWVDGELEEAQRSSLAEGTSPFPLVTRWKPSSPGTHTLAVRAFNSQDARAHVTIGVEAVGLPDRDGDGLADEGDLCPDEAGLGTAAGCPDADGDGVADADDACPTELGTAEGGGCPLAAEGDRDGDGLPDESDACPDEPGPQVTDGCPDADGDGVADVDDDCPEEPGLRQLEGCPGASDLDGDGMNDEDDDCPAEPGLPEQGGCPDTDGDGVRDPDDLLPEEAGGAEGHGAPDTGAPDSDGDGLADDAERCDEEVGSAEHDGCPPPGAGADLDGDGRPDDADPPGGALPLWPPPGGVLADPEGATLRLDVEALEFQVFDRYDEIYCYVGLAGEGMERYGPFQPVGETHWDIAALLGGENSRPIMLPEGEDLEVRLECAAYQTLREVTEPEEGFGDVGAEAAYFDLGSFARQHPREDWDGQPITVQSEGGLEGRFFRATYRICADSCGETALPAPHLWSQQIFGGQRFLI